MGKVYSICTTIHPAISFQTLLFRLLREDCGFVGAIALLNSLKRSCVAAVIELEIHIAVEGRAQTESL